MLEEMKKKKSIKKKKRRREGRAGGGGECYKARKYWFWVEMNVEKACHLLKEGFSHTGQTSEVCFCAEKKTVHKNYLLWRSFRKMLSQFFHVQSLLSPFLSYLKPQEVPAFSKIIWSNMLESLNINVYTSG